jgi:hypothetical protein
MENAVKAECQIEEQAESYLKYDADKPSRYLPLI